MVTITRPLPAVAATKSPLKRAPPVVKFAVEAVTKTPLPVVAPVIDILIAAPLVSEFAVIPNDWVVFVVESVNEEGSTNAEAELEAVKVAAVIEPVLE